MGSEHYCLRWNNHQSNLLGVFSQLLQDESLVDVTLACAEGHSIRAHKVVLSACSSYFQTLFVDHPNRHPIVILKDVCFAELRTLVEFMYKGEVNVEYCQLSALLKTAESLKVKGLAEMTNLSSTTTSIKREKDDRIDRVERVDRVEGVQQPTPQQQPQQQQASGSSSSSEMPSAPEVAGNKRLINDDTNSPSPGRNGSPGPPPNKRGRDCEDGSSDCEREHAESPDRERSPGPTDMSASGMAGISQLPQCSSRLSSPHLSEMFPGPSGLPPVQQVPLSLKKEVEWEREDNKSTAGESSSDYRHPHDSQDGEELGGTRLGSCSPRLFLCVYCGVRFPHQSKLSRHILSHTLETLKYREQSQLQIHPLLGLEPLNLMESHFGSGRQPFPEHFEPPPPDGSSELDFSHGDCQPNVVLCKFCGKSFPDVGSLIAHLPVHTGDRPFKCEFCGKAFKLRHHMKDHCRVHTGERPFRCSLCGKTFSRSTILKAHEKTHYPKFVHKFLAPSPVDGEESSPQSQQ